MLEKYDPDFLDDDALSPEQAEALRALCASDPGLAAALSHWRQLQTAVRERLAMHLPERRLLVLYALETAGRAELLAPAEAQELEAARPQLEQALQAYPALADVVARICEETDAFEACWAAHFSEGRAPAPSGAPDRPARRRPGAGMRRLWRGVMGVAVVAFAALVLLLAQRDRHMVVVATGADEMRRIELADGSVVRLMAHSSLAYADPEAAAFDRRARLEGQAFFDIAPAGEGFTVETATAQATVLGTRFGIQADAAATEVVLASGRLALAPRGLPDRMVVLEPGEMSRVADSALPSTPVPVDLLEALEWTGLFLFDATPVEVIAGRLARHYGVPVEVAPPLAREEVTGTFERARPLDEILTVVATALDAQVRPLPGGGYLLTTEAAR